MDVVHVDVRLPLHDRSLATLESSIALLLKEERQSEIDWRRLIQIGFFASATSRQVGRLLCEPDRRIDMARRSAYLLCQRFVAVGTRIMERDPPPTHYQQFRVCVEQVRE